MEMTLILSLNVLPFVWLRKEIFSGFCALCLLSQEGFRSIKDLIFEREEEMRNLEFQSRRVTASFTRFIFCHTMAKSITENRINYIMS
jgi:hypothetical protein